MVENLLLKKMSAEEMQKNDFSFSKDYLTNKKLWNLPSKTKNGIQKKKKKPKMWPQKDLKEKQIKNKEKEFISNLNQNIAVTKEERNTDPPPLKCFYLIDFKTAESDIKSYILADFYNSLLNCYEFSFHSENDMTIIKNLSKNSEKAIPKNLCSSLKIDELINKLLMDEEKFPLEKEMPIVKNLSKNSKNDILQNLRASLRIDELINELLMDEEKFHLEKEIKCPYSFCEKTFQLPKRHFKRYHPEFPKWKKDLCIVLLLLKSNRNQQILIYKCKLCNSLELHLNDHLCHKHHLSKNRKFYKSTVKKSKKILLYFKDLENEILLLAFKWFRQSQGAKTEFISKEISFLHHVLAGLRNGPEPASVFIRKLIYSNLHQVLKNLLLQNQPLHLQIVRQLIIINSFLEFLHLNSDILANDDWCKITVKMPSWDVVEFNERQLRLVSWNI